MPHLPQVDLGQLLEEETMNAIITFLTMIAIVTMCSFAFMALDRPWRMKDILLFRNHERFDHLWSCGFWLIILNGLLIAIYYLLIIYYLSTMS